MFDNLEISGLRSLDLGGANGVALNELLTNAGYNAMPTDVVKQTAGLPKGTPMGTGSTPGAGGSNGGSRPGITISYPHLFVAMAVIAFLAIIYMAFIK